MNNKTTAATIMLLCTVSAVIGAFALTQAATEQTITTDANTTQQNIDSIQQNGAGMMMNQQFGNGPNGHAGHTWQDNSAAGNLEVSSEYTAKVNTILSADSDTQALLSGGYNVTQIRPIVKNVVGEDGTVTAKASTAIVTLQNGTEGTSMVRVDVENSKVLYIETTTRTVIDKTVN